jgi:hypothetical protein
MIGWRAERAAFGCRGSRLSHNVLLSSSACGEAARASSPGYANALAAGRGGPSQVSSSSTRSQEGGGVRRRRDELHGSGDNALSSDDLVQLA